MTAYKSTPRLLGAAFLIVIVTSMASGLMLSSAVGSGSISDMLVNAAGHATLLRISALVDLFTSAGIIVLAALLYFVLKKQHLVMALVALGWWLAEAIVLGFSKIGSLALVSLGQDFVGAATPASSWYQTMGDFLYWGISQTGYTMHMLFYCIGGILWYSLLYKSRIVPRAISLFGIAAVAVGFCGIALKLLGSDVPMMVYFPIGIFELALGLWLVVRGARGDWLETA